MKKTNTKKDFERLHTYYQKRAYTRLIKDFRKMLGEIPYNNLTGANSRAIIALNINDETLKKTLYNLYLDIGLKYGKHVVRDLNKTIENKAKKPYPLFSENFIKFITDFFEKSGGKKVVSLTETMTDKVLKVISDSQAEGLTQAETIDLVKKTVNKPSFYRYNAMRIARTESLFAMNAAKVKSFKDSTIKVVKVWRQGGSRHPRADHSIMDGTEVQSESPFTLPNGERCMFPGDPSLSAGSVINCSCSISYKPVRDSNGDLVYK